MSKPSRRPYRRQSDRRIWVQGERHHTPDTRRLSKALLAHARELAQAQAEAEANRLHQQQEPTQPDDTSEAPDER